MSEEMRPEQELSEILQIRRDKLKELQESGNDPFTITRFVSDNDSGNIKENFDALEGQEVLFPVALPGALWRESGRYESVGNELLRFRDRGGAEMVLGMTHEEAAYAEEHYTVCNRKKEEGGIMLTLISKEKPAVNAKVVMPSLEDVYMYYFGEEAEEE